MRACDVIFQLQTWTTPIWHTMCLQFNEDVFLRKSVDFLRRIIVDRWHFPISSLHSQHRVSQFWKQKLFLHQCNLPAIYYTTCLKMVTLGQSEVGFLRMSKPRILIFKNNGSQNCVFQIINIETWFVYTLDWALWRHWFSFSPFLKSRFFWLRNDDMCLYVFCTNNVNSNVICLCKTI